MKKKKYIRPMISVLDVDIHNCLLGTSIITPHKDACESWTQNMQDVLGDLGEGLHGGFHNDFKVDDSWGDDDEAL